MSDVTTINSLCYQGKVDLYIQSKNKKEIHLATLNKGLKGVSELFTRACLGYDTSKYRPSKLDVKNSSDQSVLIQPVMLRASTFDFISSGEYSQWSFPIFDALILTTNMQAIETGVYKLVLESEESEIAEVQLYITNGADTHETLPTLHKR